MIWIDPPTMFDRNSSAIIIWVWAKVSAAQIRSLLPRPFSSAGKVDALHTLSCVVVKAVAAWSHMLSTPRRWPKGSSRSSWTFHSFLSRWPTTRRISMLSSMGSSVLLNLSRNVTMSISRCIPTASTNTSSYWESSFMAINLTPRNTPATSFTKCWLIAKLSMIWRLPIG